MMETPSGFWSGGHGALLRALRQEEKEALAYLKRALESESDPGVRQHFRDQIKQVKAEFKAKRKAAGSSLFTKA